MSFVAGHQAPGDSMTGPDRPLGEPRTPMERNPGFTPRQDQRPTVGQESSNQVRGFESAMSDLPPQMMEMLLLPQILDLLLGLDSPMRMPTLFKVDFLFPPYLLTASRAETQK